MDLIDVISNGVNPGTSVEITKEATFLVNNTLILIFNQVAADAVPSIIINDEIITNSTNLGPDPATAWSGFEIVTVSGASFDAAASASFDVSPFTSLVFSDADTRATASGGGSIPIGGSWTPGASGDLVIDAVLGAGTTEDPFTVFALKETPIPVPEPSSLGLLGLGVASLALRRRRRPVA
ncbi:MAG: PEP-CTERM sorting domain-containing protein [Deltaproteobacteria bacterium]|nr:PEP-CTERM sorting domain-containing protein [Deltaproteobacteria bacterium]